MPDLYHQFGEDLQVSASGDIAIVDGTTLGTQRVLRRLLTAAGDYIFHTDYGAGLPERVGALLNLSDLRSTIRDQIFKEAVVSRIPPPAISVSTVPGQIGAVSVKIAYNDAFSGLQASLSFDLTQ